VSTPGRRRFILLAASSVCFARSAIAQQRVYRVGVLRPTAAGGDEVMVTGLQRALREAGYAEGQNFVLDVRYADNKLNRLPALAQELVAARADVMVTVGEAATRAAKATPGAPPIVFFGNFDPVKMGLVASLGKPGGRMTGVVIAPDGTLAGKKVEHLVQCVPGAKRMAMLLPDDPNVARQQLPEVRRTAAAFGIDVLPVEVREGNYRAAFERIEQVRAQLLFVASSTYFVRDRAQIIDLANRYKLPAMYEWPDQVEAGGLIALGPSRTAIYARIADYVDRILKGANAGDLPVEQPAKVELVINLKTAKAMGLALPQSLLLRADRVIE
jgi:putative ABC transport system substrate-binding protein